MRFDLVKGIKEIKALFYLPNRKKRTESVIFFIAVTLIVLIFISILLPYVVRAPLTGTDALKYGNIGKILFTERSLIYRWISPYPKTGYYFYTNHAPSFPLLLTWDKIVCNVFKSDNDFYYKSITPYYSLLLVALLLFWISKLNKYLALIGVFIFLSGFSFTHNLMSNHLDFFRIFFLTVSWIFLAYAIEKGDTLSFTLLGVFSGLAAFSHTIGAVLVIFNCLALFFFLRGRLEYKCVKTSNIILLMVIFGGIHYIIDTIWGFGWIIFPRDITFWG